MFGYKLNELEDDGFDLSWRDVTELIRHITFVFVVAFFVAILGLRMGILDIISRALHPVTVSNVFCAIFAFSVPLYLLCLIIDSIDGRRLVKACGFDKLLIVEMMQLLFYDITFIFFYFKRYIIIFLILAIISAVGLLTLWVGH